MRIVGILLAAGQGSRFGGDKLLAALPDGTPMGVQSALNLREAINEVIAVTRPDDQVLAERLVATGVTVVPCPSARDGMGSSLAHAVRARSDADAWIVALADMPMIRPATIRAIAARLEQGGAMVAPSFEGRRGHPVGFAGRYGAVLAALTGDAGAREVLRAERDNVALVEVDDPGVLADFDTKAALEASLGRPT